MILSDRDILARLERGDINITPAPNLETQLQPASLDLRLGFVEDERRDGLVFLSRSLG